jgi:hypothetical protein
MRDWLVHDFNSTAGGAYPLNSDEELDALGVLQPGYVKRRRAKGVPLKALYIDRVRSHGGRGVL